MYMSCTHVGMCEIPYASTDVATDLPADFNTSTSSVDFSTAMNLDRLQMGPIEFSGTVSILKCMCEYVRIGTQT